MQVKAGSKCDIAGIKVGEIILAINGVSLAIYVNTMRFCKCHVFANGTP